MKRRRIQVGSRVQWTYLGKVGDTGTVIKVTPKRLSGGSTALVRVRWDSSNHVGVVEDRVLRLVEPGAGSAHDNRLFPLRMRINEWEGDAEGFWIRGDSPENPELLINAPGVVPLGTNFERMQNRAFGHRIYLSMGTPHNTRWVAEMTPEGMAAAFVALDYFFEENELATPLELQDALVALDAWLEHGKG